MNNERQGSPLQKKINYYPADVENPLIHREKRHEENPGASVLLTTAGGVAEGIATSSIALSAAAEGTGGLAGYSSGLAAILTKVGCGSVSAITSFSLLTAGPIIGMILGLAVYKGIKKTKI